MLCNKLKDKTIMLLGYYHHPQCGREQHKLFLCSFFGFFLSTMKQTCRLLKLVSLPLHAALVEGAGEGGWRAEDC